MSTGYGQDTWCADSLSPGRYARGAMLVIQALYRRLITPRGMLRGGDDERAYGFDVSAYVGAVGGTTAALALPGLVRGELLKDDRVSPDLEVEATVYEGADGLDEITVSVSGSLEDASQDFAFTLKVTAVTTTILGITQ